MKLDLVLVSTLVAGGAARELSRRQDTTSGESAECETWSTKLSEIDAMFDRCTGDASFDDGADTAEVEPSLDCVCEPDNLKLTSEYLDAAKGCLGPDYDQDEPQSFPSYDGCPNGVSLKEFLENPEKAEKDANAAAEDDSDSGASTTPKSIFSVVAFATGIGLLGVAF